MDAIFVEKPIKLYMNNTIKYKTISFKTTSVPRWGKIDALLDYLKQIT